MIVTFFNLIYDMRGIVTFFNLIYDMRGISDRVRDMYIN